MDKYLLEILKEVNTIIIPGLGALTITNAETGEIMFMSYLKHDDGKLASYIVNKEGIDENEAKNRIAKYVRQIQTELDKGESYDMFEFGSFYKKNDEIDFKNWEGTSAKGASVKKADPKPEIKKVSEKEEKTVEEIPMSTKEPEKKIEKIKEIKAEKVPEEIPDKKKSDIKKVVEAETVEKITETKEPSKKQSEKESDVKKELNIIEKKELAATTAKMNKLKEKQNAKPQKKKRGVAFWVLIGLIMLIVSGGTYVGLNYETVRQHIPFLADNNEQSDKIEKKSRKDKMKEILGQGEQEEDEVMEDNSENQNPVEEMDEPIVEEKVVEKPIVSESNSSNDLPFHIIAGSFSSEANANRLADKFREKGYATSVSFGRGMYLVSIKSYSSKADAQAGLSEIKADAPKAWVYEK